MTGLCDKGLVGLHGWRVALGKGFDVVGWDCDRVMGLFLEV